MFSAADSLAQERLGTARLAPPHAWEAFPVSELARHGEPCCEIAREWLIAMDFAQLNGSPISSGPRWLRERYEWGPSPWPMHWCEVVSRKVIDCGAHSALAHEAFRARGMTAFRAQFVQRYSTDAIRQWRLRWASEDIPDQWLGENLIYHEGNAVLVGSEMKLWDSSAGWWIDPVQTCAGYGSLCEVRIVADHGWDTPILQWGRHRLRFNVWCCL